MNRFKVIANPAAGSGTARRAIPRLEQLLKEIGLDFDLIVTERPGHAIQLARQAVEAKYHIVVAAGGDGTANEVINGLIEAQEAGHGEAALGVIGLGRGRDFAHGMGVPDELSAACQVLAADKRRPIDIGRVAGGLFPQGRYFGNCVGVGFDAITTIQVSRLPRLGGFMSFFIAVLQTILIYYRATQTRVEFDGETITQPSLLVSVMNGRRLGGGFWMAPTAEPDDGLYDLCMAEGMSRLRMMQMIPHFLRGTQATQPEIRTAQAAQIVISAVDGTLPAQTDGEILCVDGKRLEIALLPQRLEVVTTPRGGLG